MLPRACLFVFMQKTSSVMRIGDWSSDVCSSDLGTARIYPAAAATEPVASYLDIVQTLNAHGARQRYPGSPLFAAHYARAADRIVLCEREAAIAAELKAELDRKSTRLNSSH